MQSLWQDLRYGARMLIKNPSFTLIAVLTLALGIGANTAIFSVVKGVLLRPLPYAEPQQLVRLFETVERSAMAGDRMEVAPANFLDWRSQTQSFSGLAAYGLTGSVISEGGEAEHLEGSLVTADFFSTLGAVPLRGRTFTVEDEQASGRLVIIGHDVWQRRFGGAEDLVGRTIQLDGFSFTVIGIMPPGFQYPQRTQIYELYRLSPAQREMREAHFLKVVARLKPGVTITQAQAELSGVARRLAEQYPQTNRNWSANVVPLFDEQVGQVRPALLALLGAVGLVLLIACINVASLLLARATSRQSEIGIRLALGAGRGRIIRQLLTESLLLAVLGGVTGLLLGGWALDGLMALAPENLPRLGEVRLDAGVLGFTLLLSLLTGALFGLAPAWQAARQDVNATLKQGPSRHSGQRRLFSTLVVAEIALTLMVLLGAGLLINSFLRMQQVEPGLDVDRLLTVSFEAPSARYNGNDWRTHRTNFWNQLSTRVAALPGVEAVGAIDSLPFSGRSRVWRFRRDGEEANAAASLAASFQVATSDYFRTVGMKLRRGRAFTVSDAENTPPVAVINETMARRFWPNAEALGQRIVIRNETFAREIVGVVGDLKHFGLDQETQPEMYAPFAQFVIDVMPMVVRVQGNPATFASAIRQQVQQVDATVAIERILPMQQVLSGSFAARRFTMLLLGAFAAVALLLAGVGVYGVMAYSVSERTREIGVRLALGAQTSDVLRLVLKQSLTLAAVGVGIGLLASFALARLMKNLLFGVTAHDPLTFATVAVLLTVVALLACWIPARRATQVNPVVALKYE
jgi:putative ABC transport system permease protein